ncbi:hypothetical protein DL764_007755 [Monosporascus ibericus]|uniref:Uncharacterized protein n=1 Tax=Monosporascus ibericus TaxID=155417 RepID=A0A4Q4T2C5_9PEZI|nr:hypothetical protein DL764_007755 [Monosporascus ibericus]
MVGLPSPHQFVDSSYSSLRQYSSNPSLGSGWKNGSTPDLTKPPMAVEQGARPSTSCKARPRIDPIDVSVTRDTSSASLPPPKSPAATPKSPLGQYELTLNLPSEGAYLFGGSEDVLKAPEPLRIVKKSRGIERAEDQAISPLGKPPSPPQSIKADEIDRSPALGRVSSPREMDRPSSGSTYRGRSVDLDNEFRELSENLSYGPSAMPSPPTSVRHASERTSNDAPMEDWEAPIIRNVTAKHDTPTFNSARRKSMELRIEKSDTLFTTTGPGIPRKSSARAARPAALNLDVRSAPSDWNGPKSAPFAMSRPPWTPLEQSPLRRYPAADDCEPKTTLDGNFDHDAPQTPESPVLPPSGQLASQGNPATRPRIALIRRNTEPEEDPEERIRNFRFPDLPRLEEFPTSGRTEPISTAAALTSSPPNYAVSPTYTLPAPPPLKRVATTPDLPNWPLPSPTIGLPPTLEPPPRMPAALAESRTSRVRSFSRPWTPTREPLRFEITTPTTATAMTATPASGTASPRREQSPCQPPPRSPPFAVMDRGLRSPGIVGDDFGGGFI